MLVERDDRRHRREGKLEARPDQRFRPQQRHHERPRRDQPQRHRLAPQRHRAEHQQRGHAATDRRHLAARQQRIANRRRRADQAGQHRHPPRQRQPRAEREQARGEQHRDPHGGGDVQAADRQQVREAGAPHRLRIHVGDRAGVAGRERRRDPARAAFKLLMDMAREADAQALALVIAAGQDRHRRQPAPGRAEAVEPRDAREIIGARHGRRRGRHQACAHRHDRALGDAGGRIGHGEVDADAGRRRIGRMIEPARRRQRQADQRARRQRLHPLDPRLEPRHGRARQNRGRRLLRLPPHERHARRQRHPGDRDAAPRAPSAPQRHCKRRHG